MANTDSFGQTKPTFVEDPLAPGAPLRDAAGDLLGQTGHLKNQFGTTEQVIVSGLNISGTIDLPELAFAVLSVKAYVAASGAPAAKELLDLTTDYTVSEALVGDPDEQPIGDQQALATKAGGTDSFGQSKPTFVDADAAGTPLVTNYKHQNFFSVTRLTMVSDQSLNNLVVTYSAYTQKGHQELP
ncbi:MAG: hypothetical protein ACXABY_07320 [Candidatus Thorarchaeota archaeon]|jgi:hypothetical protein